MKKLLTLSILLFTMVFTYTTIAQEMGAIRRSVEYSFPEKIQKLVLDPLPAGTYSVGTGGDFPTIDSAFNKLSIDGIAGEVILELIDELYTAPSVQFGFVLNGPIPGAGPNSRVTIKPAENKNVTIEGNNEGLLYFINTSYVTIDGIDLTGSTTLTIHTLETQFPFNDTIDFMNNSDHNIVQNVTFISEDSGFGPSFFPDYPAGSLFAPDSNLIQNNFIKKGGIAIYVSAEFSAVEAIGNIIRGNIVGSETDSLISWGIQAQFTRNTIIENNIVNSIRGDNLQGLQVNTPGINSYNGSGIIIRNNIVHNVGSDAGFNSVGILLAASSNDRGSNNQVYNNMIYDIQSTSTQSNSHVAGIEIWNQDNPKIYYNSVYLTGTGSNHQGSAAFYIYSGAGGSSGVDLKNNIFVNSRDESPYFATTIYDYTASNLTSDYNDLYYEPNQYNSLVRIGSTNYNTLAGWQATGQDINSVSKAVNFFSATDLHLTGTSNGDIDLIGIPIAGITTDIDDDTRNALYPYKGADEASVPLPVELTSFTAQPENQRVILKWTTASELNNNGFEIQRKIAESEFVTIGFVRGEGTTTNQKDYSYIDKELVDGKYFYRLKQVDYNGTFEYSDVIEVDVRTLDEFVLEQNFPNPFNPSTKITYSIPEWSNVSLKVFDLLGSEVMELVKGEIEAGTYDINFNASQLTSGIYFYKLQAGSFIQTRKMILLK